MIDGFPNNGITYIKKKQVKVTPEERKKILEKTGNCVFNFPANFTTIDFLSDSGSGALTQHMWMAMQMGDESYGRNNWYYALLDAMRDYLERGDNPKKAYLKLIASNVKSEELSDELLFPSIGEDSFIGDSNQQLEQPNAYILPQGRCCESLLFNTLKHLNQEQQTTERNIVLSNGLFDTTRANCETRGFEGINLMDPELFEGIPIEKIGKMNPFRGGIDLIALENFLKEKSERVVMVIMTLTNNTGAGQPVSLENLQQVREITQRFNIPLWLDGCRLHENAAFNKFYNKSCANLSIPEIIKKMVSLCDGIHISMKKMLCNMGGFMAIRKDGFLYQQYPELGTRLKEAQIIEYGNDSYGALSGRDLAAATVAVYESVDEDFLKSRIGQTLYVGKELAQKGVPIITPPGGHALFLDINKMFPDREWNEFVGVGLTIKMIESYGIRGCELGYMAWELDKYVDKYKKFPDNMPPNFVRFAIPAQAYHKEHFDYFISSLVEINKNKESVPSVKIVKGKDANLRHFVVQCELIERRKSDIRVEVSEKIQMNVAECKEHLSTTTL